MSEPSGQRAGAGTVAVPPATAPSNGTIRPRARNTGRPNRLRRRDTRAAYLFLAPWLTGMIAITLGPILASLYLSFTDYSLLRPPRWIGSRNYSRMLGDERLMTSLGVTFRYVFVSVPLQLAVALAMALMLNRGVRGLALYRSVYYLPSLLAGSVSIAILWRQMFGTDGLVNDLLALVGIRGVGWIAHPDYALDTLVVLNIWTFGAPMVIFLAGLRQIPAMYYEAATVDGAGRWARLRHVTIPLLTPVIFFNLVLELIGAFQTFTQAFVVSGGTGAPSDQTLFYTLYLYQRGFGSFQMGYASALAWLLLLIIAAFTALNFLLAKRWVFYGD